MHPILLEYSKRFKKTDQKKLEISSFFTSLGANYKSELPYLYDIEKACKRMIEALKNDEKVCIYSDYDTDAVTATATMYWGLILLGFKAENIDFYAPDRFSEGYGMNPEAVEMLCEKYQLIISVDCGINSTAEAKVCLEKGVDLIITDHHHLTADIPDALSVINPRLSLIYNQDNLNKIDRQNYLSQTVTGVGVAWFVIVWLGYEIQNDTELDFKFEMKDLNQLLTFVAIGTIADCQSILDETNRLLVKSGLKILQHLCKQVQPNQILYGLWLILDQSGLRNQVANGYTLVSSDLGFTLSPILNSSGRLSHASHSIQCLLAGDLLLKINGENEATELIAGLIATNTQRKHEVARILSDVENEARIQYEAGKNIIWVASTEWSKGLIGLLASRLVNDFGLPVVVVELPEPENNGAKNQKATASLRAPEGYSLPLAMNQDPSLFIKFGGHPGAAGFSAEIQNLEQIEILLDTELAKQISSDLEIEKVDFSNQIVDKYTQNLDQISSQKLKILSHKINTIWVDQTELADPSFWSSLLEMEPFGQDFLYPYLIFPFRIEKYQTLSENKHIKFEWNIDPNFRLDLLWFNYNKNQKNPIDLSQFSKEKLFYIMGRPASNAWNNKVNWQIIIDEIFITN